MEEQEENKNPEESVAEEAQANLETEAAGENKEEQAEKEEPKQPSPEEVIAELNDKYLRLRADFDNYRKRMAREANDTRERSKMLVITEFLPVYDFFKMAMDHAAHTEDFNALKQGMQMIMNEFTRTFDGLGIKEIQAVGKPFDPQMHEAVKTEASDTVPEGIVVSQWKPGYFVGDKLARPATVVVSSGPAKTEEAKTEEAKEEPAEAAGNEAEKN